MRPLGFEKENPVHPLSVAPKFKGTTGALSHSRYHHQEPQDLQLKRPHTLSQDAVFLRLFISQSHM